MYGIIAILYQVIVLQYDIHFDPIFSKLIVRYNIMILRLQAYFVYCNILIFISRNG